MQWNPSFKCPETSNAGIALRSIPAYSSKEIGGETWTGFNDKLTPVQNKTNNKKWIEDKIAEGYSVVDIGQDPHYKGPKGSTSLKKGPYYGVETNTAFGTTDWWPL